MIFLFFPDFDFPGFFIFFPYFRFFPDFQLFPKFSIFPEKCQKYQIIQIFQNTKKMELCGLTSKIKFGISKKSPNFFFQKMPNIPELPKNAKMRLFSLIFKHCVDQVFQTKTLFFVKSFATVESSNPWFSAICLHFLSAVCLLFCLHCQLIVYFFNFQEKHWKIMTFLPKIWV